MKFDSLAGRLVRVPLGLIPGRAIIRVRSGINKGLRWRVGSATHGCWMGHYESDIQSQLPGLVREGSVCYDIGANAGFYTLALARLTGARGRVIAFEPLAENAAHILDHLSLNNLPQASLVQIAVGDADTISGFEGHDSPSMAHLSDIATARYLVPVVRLDTIIARDNLPAPNFIKMDIEGGEWAALRGAEATLSVHRPSLVLALHGPELFFGCVGILTKHGYAIRDLAGRVLTPESVPASEVIAVHPSLHQ